METIKMARSTVDQTLEALKRAQNYDPAIARAIIKLQKILDPLESKTEAASDCGAEPVAEVCTIHYGGQAPAAATIKLLCQTTEYHELPIREGDKLYTHSQFRQESKRLNTKIIQLVDRELLELAALACGIPLVWSGPQLNIPRRVDTWELWNPFDDDGDALRLAVKLDFINPGCWPNPGDIVMEQVKKTGLGDWNVATRLAIVRAAADIGRQIRERSAA